jgi:LPS-assembly lipoprotein
MLHSFVSADKQRFFWISFLTLFLVACGFHLRGNVPLPKTLSPMYIATNKPYDPLVELIEDTLTASHIELVDSPKNASTILNLIDIQYVENLVSVAASTNTRQYTLLEILRMELTTTKGKIVIPVSTLTASNPLTVDSNQMLNTSVQKQTLQQEMQQAVVQQLMIRLGSPNTNKALAGAPVDSQAKTDTDYIEVVHNTN